MNPIKTYIASSFLMLLCFQLLHKTAYQLYFVLNQAAITKLHCENKSRPEIKCDGKCHLRKYLEQEEAVAVNETQEEGPAKVPFPKPEKSKNWHLYLYDITSEEFGVAPSTLYLLQTNQLYWPYQRMKGHLFSTKVFQPPCLA